MNRSQMVGALEAVIFASGDPLTTNEIKKIFDRYWADLGEEERKQRSAELKEAIAELKAKWADDSPGSGFVLREVAEGLAFRTNPAFADMLKAMREQRPVRLSRAALETLSIVAYRQPTTKPEVDHIRGVDSGGTIRLLLDRGLIRIVGKKEEPGLPLLYGTTREFLSFFNINNLAQLPTLREYHELTKDSEEELQQFDSESLEEISKKAGHLRDEEEPAVLDLEQAVANLKERESAARMALAQEGLSIDGEEDDEAAESRGKNVRPIAGEGAVDSVQEERGQESSSAGRDDESALREQSHTGHSDEAAAEGADAGAQSAGTVADGSHGSDTDSSSTQQQNREEQG